MMMEDIVRIDIDKELFALIASLESSIEACDALNNQREPSIPLHRWYQKSMQNPRRFQISSTLQW